MGYPESYNELEQWRDELRRSRSGAEIIRAIEGRIAGEGDPERGDILNRLLLQEHLAQGNSAAAEEIRARDPSRQIYRWHEGLRESDNEIEIIAAIKERIRTESHPVSLHALRLLLAREHRERGDYIAAEAIYLADAEAGCDPWRSLICLASQKLFEEELPIEAVPIIDRAVAAAMAAGVFRREALGMKARIAVALRDYAVVENVLRQIMALTLTRGHADIGVERDFFDCLPLNSINPEIARAYDEYCRARARRRAAAAEEIDEFILLSARIQWLKVSRIIAEVLEECEHRQLAADEWAVAGRIRIMAADGRLKTHGDLAHWRDSEVRLST
jgi:hypothetical protein